ncbi:MAG: chemotaxis protein CheB [Thermodesulfobacteriota bacterium]
MTSSIKSEAPAGPVRVLLIDDSPSLRQLCKGMLKPFGDIVVTGEADNGITGLDLVLKQKPDVILLDVEMPLMDGLTTLQHLMIHTPTPTIVFSSLSRRGTPRCFDAFKYGAVDFVFKPEFFQDSHQKALSQLLYQKVYEASRVNVDSVDPMQTVVHEKHEDAIDEGVVYFCEECGARCSLESSCLKNKKKIYCGQCGEELQPSQRDRYHRMGFITAIGTGRDGYFNLLQIIPNCRPDMGGALIVVIHDQADQVDSFARYLDSICEMRVRRGFDGLTIEGGKCYLLTGSEYCVISHRTGSYTFQIDDHCSTEMGYGIDLLMGTVRKYMKEHCAGVLFSVRSDDGIMGVGAIVESGGRGIVLSAERCLVKRTREPEIPAIRHETELVETIRKMHLSQKTSVVTA